MAVRTGITRPFDLSYPSNRFILAAIPGVGVVAGLVTLVGGDGWAGAVRHGFSAGGIAFLTWTIARELHPDRPWVATVAVFVAPFGLLLGEPDLLASATVMLCARVVAGTTGRALHWFDVALISALAAPLAVRPTGSGVLTATAVAYAAVIPRQDRRRSRLVVVVATLALLAGYAWWWVEFGFDPEPWLAGVAALGLLSLLGPSSVAVGADRPGAVIEPRRVRAARGYALIAAVAAASTADPAAMAPVWAALAVVGVRP